MIEKYIDFLKNDFGQNKIALIIFNFFGSTELTLLTHDLNIVLCRLLSQVLKQQQQ